MTRLSVGALIAFVVLVAHASAMAAGNAVVSFSPTAASGAVGATIPVDVTIANVDPSPGLANYDLMLHFDPAVVRLDLFKDSGFVMSVGDVFCGTAQIDNVAGTAEAQCEALPLGMQGVSTTGAVALLHASFTALAAGSSPLTISGSLAGPSSLAEPSGPAIAASFANGSIRVTAGAAASPGGAATATATASPEPSAASAAIPGTTPASNAPSAAAGASNPATEGVRLPDTGDGADGSSENWARDLWRLGLGVSIAAALALSLRQLWRSHTRHH